MKWIKIALGLMVTLMVLYVAVPSFAAEVGEEGTSKEAYEQANRRSIFNRTSDWFATIFRSQESKERIMQERNAKRAEKRAAREAAIAEERAAEEAYRAERRAAKEEYEQTYRRSIFNRTSDWFATIGRSQESKERIIQARNTKRAEKRAAREAARAEGRAETRVETAAETRVETGAETRVAMEAEKAKMEAEKAAAEQRNAVSVTLSIDRTPMPQTVFHPGRFLTGSATVELYDFMIRDYTGAPIEGFIIQTSSGRTLIPIETVEDIRMSRWSSRRTDDIYLTENVVEFRMNLTDGTTRSGLMNADFGTVEGKTALGDFFLADPLYVRHLVFNR